METAAARRHASLGVTSLSHRLAKQFSTADHGDGAGNLVFSPLSIYAALSLVAAGAQGKTLQELLDLLGTRSRQDLVMNARTMVEQAIPASPQQGGGPRVSYASGVWHDSTRKLKPAYRDVAAAAMRSVVCAVDFISKPEEAVELINKWVAEATNNLIDTIVDRASVSRSTRLVVTNAIYFKGVWKTPFDKQRTKKGKFHRLDGSTATAQFMSSGERQFIGLHNGFKVLKMPYSTVHGSRVAARYSMCVLLPDNRDGLQDLMDAMASSPRFLQAHLPWQDVMVGEFRVPRFKMSFSTSMRRALKDHGVQAAFSITAELPDLLEENDHSNFEPLILDDILHKAVIEVNEEGTEAAAVNAMFGYIGCSQFPPPPVNFVADHPFAFFVLEEVSGAILFAGHVLDPTEGS